jgi:L,D-transpeptidase catalytic domain/Putative peptidoglycan binding domain
VKRGLFIVGSLILCVSAGLAAAVAAGAESGPAAVGPTTTHVTTTEPPPPTTPTTPATIPPGVRIGRTDVGSYEPAAAAELVRAAFEQPLLIVYARHRFMVRPQTLGAVPSINRAVERALIAPPGSTVPLAVGVRLQRVRAYVAGLADRFGRKPADARLLLRGLKPYVTKEQRGRAVDRGRAERMIVSALVAHQRGPLTLPGRTLEPSVKRADFGAVIVIRRNSHRLYLYRGMRYWKLFPVATGTSSYPTPLGRFRIVVKWRNPWWYPPDSDWAKDLEPVPPGPSNPLGTRWMGISSPGVGIHGTPEPGSIGYSVSHGCIRMRISDAEWLFEQVPVGTPVFIVSA